MSRRAVRGGRPSLPGAACVSDAMQCHFALLRVGLEFADSEGRKMSLASRRSAPPCPAYRTSSWRHFFGVQRSLFLEDLRFEIGPPGSPLRGFASLIGAVTFCSSFAPKEGGGQIVAFLEFVGEVATAFRAIFVSRAGCGAHRSVPCLPGCHNRRPRAACVSGAPYFVFALCPGCLVFFSSGGGE